MINPWKILKVHRKSTDEEIHQTFITLARKYHPDMGGDVDKFKRINEAHTMIKTKDARQFFIDRLVGHDRCQKCNGQGYQSRSKSLTEKTYAPCTGCGGAGFLINSEEDDDVAIELGGAASSKVSRSNKGSGGRARQRGKH